MKVLPLDTHLPGVSTLSYGCMGLGGGWNDNPVNQELVKQTHDIVDVVIGSGINFFDHADIYTMGKAEEVFGRVLAERPELRGSIYLQSKCGIRFEDGQGPNRYDFSAQWIEDSVNGILRRLQTDYLDILLLHRPDPLMEADEVAGAFEKLKSSGKVRHFGVSNMQGQQMQFLQRALDMTLVANQLEMSLQHHGWLDEGICVNNDDGKAWNFAPGTLEYCQMNNVQIQSWSSLCRGIYSGRDVSNESRATQQTAQLVSRLAAEYGVSPEAILLAFLRRHPASIQPVIGTTNLDRIKACQQATDITLSREHWYSLYVTARGQNVP